MLAQLPKEIDQKFRFGPTRAWMDEVLRDGEWRRPFKIEETHEGDDVIIRAEVPGIDPEKDVTVEVDDDMLVITVQRTESHRSESDHVHRSEFRYGTFSRSIPVPGGVDESKVAASYKDGVLEVRLPSPGDTGSAPHRVPVKRG